jgi:hypothetical protein
MSVVFLDCEVEEVNSVVCFVFHSELEGWCGGVELSQYLINVSNRLSHMKLLISFRYNSFYVS